jgi:hypothetical protein
LTTANIFIRSERQIELLSNIFNDRLLYTSNTLYYNKDSYYNFFSNWTKQEKIYETFSLTYILSYTCPTEWHYIRSSILIKTDSSKTSCYKDATYTNLSVVLSKKIYKTFDCSKHLFFLNKIYIATKLSFQWSFTLHVHHVVLQQR